MLLSLILTTWGEKSKCWFLGYILFVIFQMLRAISIVIRNWKFPTCLKLTTETLEKGVKYMQS